MVEHRDRGQRQLGACPDVLRSRRDRAFSEVSLLKSRGDRGCTIKHTAPLPLSMLQHIKFMRGIALAKYNIRSETRRE